MNANVQSRHELARQDEAHFCNDGVRQIFQRLGKFVPRDDIRCRYLFLEPSLDGMLVETVSTRKVADVISWIVAISILNPDQYRSLE